MRLRRDSPLVASVLFSIALLCLTRWFWWDALTTVSRGATEPLDVWRQTGLQYISYFGESSLLIIIVGLTVTWLGYFNGSRWTWFVQFMIAAWVFRLFVLPIAGPILRGRMALSVTEWAYIAMHQSGTARSYAESLLVLFFMVLALLLPVKSFFWPQQEPAASKHPMRTIVYATGALAGIAACLLWINFRKYEISPAKMNSGQVMPAPPPPPPRTSAKN